MKRLDFKVECSSVEISTKHHDVDIIVQLSDVDNADEIAFAVADIAAPSYLVTDNNYEGLLDEIGEERVREWLEKQD